MGGEGRGQRMLAAGAFEIRRAAHTDVTTSRFFGVFYLKPQLDRYMVYAAVTRQAHMNESSGVSRTKRMTFEPYYRIATMGR
jgi:hypothetical protein